MSRTAFVKLLGQEGLFSLTKSKADKIRIHPQDKMCMLADAGPIISVKDSTLIEDGIVQANQTVIVKPNVELAPSRYHALVSHNPLLGLAGALVTPISSIVRPGEEDMIGLVIRASKKLDLSDFEHIFELYQID